MSQLRVAVFVLLLFLLFSLGGAHFLFYFQKQQVKSEVKKFITIGIDKNELVLLKFSKVESERILRWEHSKEFEFEGEMYDVVDVEVKGDSVWYWCWWDKEETKLNRLLNALTAQAMGNNPQSKEKITQITNYLHSLFLPRKLDYEAFTNKYHAYLQFYNSLYKSIDIPPEAPPPERV